MNNLQKMTLSIQLESCDDITNEYYDKYCNAHFSTQNIEHHCNSDNLINDTETMINDNKKISQNNENFSQNNNVDTQNSIIHKENSDKTLSAKNFHVKNTIKQQIVKSGFSAKKSLGQNFLIDRNVINKIASFIDNDALNIIEIGPGPGILTESIAYMHKNARILAIEKDMQFIENIRQIPNVYVINEDALKCNWNRLVLQYFQNVDKTHNSTKSNIQNIVNHNINDDTNCDGPINTYNSSKKHYNSNHDEYDALNSDLLNTYKEKQNTQVIGNLPYNVSVPILFSLLEQKHLFSKFVFMFQKEVADRIVATQSTKDYGKLSIMAQLHAKIEKSLHVPPTVFWPQPKIDSTVVSFDLNHGLFDDYVEKNSIIDKKNLYIQLEKITSLAFQQRRKTFRSIFKNAIKNNHYTTQVDYEGIFTKLNLNLENRPETFTPQDFLRIAYAITTNSND